MKPMIYRKREEKEKSTVLHQGTYDGYSFVILSLGSHPTAYVGVPLTSPFAGKDYEYVPIDVHGGLTFAGRGHIKASALTKDRYWFGWDYAHCNDYTYYGFSGPMWDSGKQWTTQEIFGHVKDVISQFKVLHSPWRRFKTFLNKAKPIVGMIGLTIIFVAVVYNLVVAQ